MSPRILQFGVTGQLASELLRQKGDLDIAALGRAEADLADPRACGDIVRMTRPDLVILAAAYTAVDQAEGEPDLALRINAEAPSEIAKACTQIGAALIHVSTDYVFDGEKGAPYLETDATDPLNVYGATKLAGEHAVLSLCPRALVIRASWVVSAHGKNFVKTMLRIAGEGRPLKVVADQFGRPTSAQDLAAFILAEVRAGLPRTGLVHFANAGETSWHGFAEEILGRPVERSTTADWPAPARRPLRGTLDTTKLETQFGVTPRPWQAALADILHDLKEVPA